MKGSLACEDSICGARTVPPVVGMYVIGSTVVGHDWAPAVAISCMFPPPVPMTVLKRGEVVLSVVETFMKAWVFADSSGIWGVVMIWFARGVWGI